MDLKYIIQVVNNHFEIDITENRRDRYMVMCRGVYFHFAKKTTNFSLARIGEKVNRDHSSVLYSLKNFENWISYDKEFENEFKKVEKILTNKKTVKEFRDERLNYKYKMLQIAKELLINEITKIKKNGQNRISKNEKRSLYITD